MPRWWHESACPQRAAIMMQSCVYQRVCAWVCRWLMYDSETYPTCLCHVSLHHSVANPQTWSVWGHMFPVQNGQSVLCVWNALLLTASQCCPHGAHGAWRNGLLTRSAPASHQIHLQLIDLQHAKIDSNRFNLFKLFPNCSTSLCRPSTLASNLMLIHINIYIIYILWMTLELSVGLWSSTCSRTSSALQRWHCAGRPVPGETSETTETTLKRHTGLNKYWQMLTNWYKFPISCLQVVHLFQSRTSWHNFAISYNILHHSWSCP